MIAIRDRVRFEETDLMAVVYHSRYLLLMEDGILFPIREIQVKYKHSARFDDEYEVQTTLREFNRAKLVFDYKVIRVKDGTIFVEGTTTNVFADKNGKIVRLPADESIVSRYGFAASERIIKTKQL